LYLIDEPSAYLDSEQRILAARVMKRWIMNAKRAAFVVEHDFIMATYLADKVIVFSGTPAIEATAAAPEGLITGMNKFLEMMDITFRRDPYNFRPRINKHRSVKDSMQKKAGQYFLMDEGAATKTATGEDDAEGEEEEETKQGNVKGPIQTEVAQQEAAAAGKKKGKKGKGAAAEEEKEEQKAQPKPAGKKGKGAAAAQEEEKKAEPAPKKKGKKAKAAAAEDDDWVDE